MSTTYESVNFSTLSAKRQEAVRETIAKMWADGYNAHEIAKKVRVNVRSVTSAMGNLTRRHMQSTPKTRTTPAKTVNRSNRR
jgi:DNA-directed RNA polymerase specialized sigma24 family protein